MSGSELVGLADRLDMISGLSRKDCVELGNVRAELRALAARLPGDGWVMVPKSALEWLDGMGEDFECPPDLYFNGKPAPYWWREEFRRRATASPAAGIGENHG